MGKKKNQSKEAGGEKKRDDKRYLIEKRNILNEATWDKKMTKPVYLLFLLYLSKINPRDINTKDVLITAAEYQELMQLEELDNDRIKKAMREFFNLQIEIRHSKTQCSIFHVFSRCDYDLDPSTGRYYFYFVAAEELVPFIFNFRDKYFKYEYQNLIELNSCHYIRLYELLKEHEYKGRWQIDVAQLKKLMYIDDGDYSSYNSFQKDLLKPCQKSIEKSTDIKFIFEPSVYGAHGKVLELLFTIEPNEHVDTITLPTTDEVPVSETQMPPLPLSINSLDVREKLSFIPGSLSDTTLLSVYQKADGDIDLIRRAYHYLKSQKNVEKPIGLLFFLIENPERIAETIELDKQGKPKNAFFNFTPRKYDFDELEKWEEELFKMNLRKDN
jgi:plasmid replication initiation protein